MPEGESRSESMEEVVTQWARKDPTATAEWLNQFPSGELMDEPIERFVREVVRKEPETALTWAEAIVDEERKQRVVTEVKRVAERVAEREQAEANGGLPGRRSARQWAWTARTSLAPVLFEESRFQVFFWFEQREALDNLR